eukprot:762755-Hanusia_phi.AAC.3
MQKVLVASVLVSLGGAGRQEMAGGGRTRNGLSLIMSESFRPSLRAAIETARAEHLPDCVSNSCASASDNDVSRQLSTGILEEQCGLDHLQYKNGVSCRGGSCHKSLQAMQTSTFCMQIKGGDQSRVRRVDKPQYGSDHHRKFKRTRDPTRLRRVDKQEGGSDHQRKFKRTRDPTRVRRVDKQEGGSDHHRKFDRRTQRKPYKTTFSKPSPLQELKGKLRAKIRSSTRSNQTESGNGRDRGHAPSEAHSVDTKKHRPGSFPALGIEDSIAKALLHAGYKFPTPVQRKSIPELLTGANVVMMARTGSGKTAAFLIPLIQRIRAISDSDWAQSKVIGIQGLVLVPTRELALQTFNFFKMYAKYTQLTACLIVGGEALEPQFAALAANPNVVIATPGRLLQLVNEVRIAKKMLSQLQA